MIGFFLLDSGGDLGRFVDRALWRENGLAILVKQLEGNDYGKNLKLILFRFHVEGTLPLPIQEFISLQRYSKKEKAISIIIPVHKREFDISDNFKNRKLITDKTLDGLDKVRQRLEKKFKDIDFDKLEKDYKTVVQNYLDLHKGEM